MKKSQESDIYQLWQIFGESVQGAKFYRRSQSSKFLCRKLTSWQPAISSFRRTWGPKNFRDAGGARPLEMRTWMTLYHLCYHAKFGRSSVIMEICHKINLTPHACLQGHSLKVIGTYTDRSATYDFHLVFYSNYGPNSYHFRDKWRYLPKKFPPLCISPLFNPKHVKFWP